MPEIRPLERADLPQVAALYEHVARSGSWDPPPGLVEYFEETFFDYPWADPEIPSLVYADDGKIGGFLGSNVRRFTFDGTPIRLAISGQLVTDPSVRKQAAGAFLLKRFLEGAQDLTITDTASDEARRIWEGLGGETMHIGSIGWARVFSPLRSVWDFKSRSGGGRLSPVVRPVFSAVDAAGSLVARRALKVDAPAGSTEVLTAEAMGEHLEAVAKPYRLRPSYDNREGTTWLLEQVARVKPRGELIARLVRAPDGRAQGWFVYYHRPGGIAQTLAVAGAGNDVGDVLDALLADARERGAVAVQGRVEPHLLERLSERRVLFHKSGYLPLIHSPRPELLHAIHSGRALLTRLAGEWWMGHHLLFTNDK
jgi:GNAT superfamily N-acetyltransferase